MGIVKFCYSKYWDNPSNKEKHNNAIGLAWKNKKVNLWLSAAVNKIFFECKIYYHCLLHFSIILRPLTYVVKINVETCHKIYMCNIVFLEDEYFTWLCRSVWDPAAVKSLSHPSLTNYNYCGAMMLQTLAYKSNSHIKFMCTSNKYVGPRQTLFKRLLKNNCIIAIIMRVRCTEYYSVFLLNISI